MSVADWIAIPGNTHQRDTDRHLLRALHLRRPSPAHLQVNAAQLPDGSLIKLDGHTRARLWQLETDLAPEFVLVAVYSVGSREEAEALYYHFDAKSAVDTASDDLSSAFSATGFKPVSPYFRAYRGTVAIRLASTLMMTGSEALTATSLDIRLLVPRWLKEMELIDALNVTQQRFTNPIMAAALLTIRRRGDRAVEVWDRYQRDLGTKTGEEMDGVEALSRLLMAGTASSGSYNNLKKSVARTVACIEAALDGTLLRVTRAVSLSRYCHGMKREMATFSDLLELNQKERTARWNTAAALRKLATDHQRTLN
jgi:hypothetical protein